MNKINLLVGTAIVALMTASAAEAGTLYIANMNQAGENPPSGSPFVGAGFVTLNDAQTSATITATHNISVTVTGGQIQRGAATVNGPVIFPFPVPTSPVGPLTWALSAADVTDLKALGLYMNFTTLADPGGTIRGTLVRTLLSPSGTNSVQTAVANALDVSAGYNTDLEQILKTQAVASAATRSQVLEDLSGRTVYAQGREVVETMAGFEASLISHAEEQGHSHDLGFAGFVRGGDAFGKRDTTLDQAGSKTSRLFVMGGFDYGLATDVSAGLAFGYADGEDKFLNSLGKTQAQTMSIQAYASIVATGVELATVAGYGWTKFDTTRSLASLARTATSSHDSNAWSLGAKVSAPIVFGNKLTVSPYALLSIQQAKIDAYAETGASSAGLVVPKRTDKNTAIEAGAALLMPLGTNGDTSARVEAGWRYLVDNGSGTVATSLVGTPVVFTTNILSPGDSAVHGAVSLTSRLTNFLSGSVGYRGAVSSRTSSHTIEGRLTLRL